MKIIGILGGMGPRSTTPFLELIFDQCKEQYGAKYDMDFPHIIIYSLPTPFYLDRPIDENNLKETVIEGLKKLQSFGVSFIAMPCNTVHKYYDELLANIDVPMLNIVDETVKYIPQNKKVTLFGTEITRKSRVYQIEFENKGIDYIFKESWQDSINNIISMIKLGDNISFITQKWNELICDVKAKGVEVIVIACTDLNVVIQQSKKHNSLEFIDSSESLAKAAVVLYLR